MSISSHSKREIFQVSFVTRIGTLTAIGCVPCPIAEFLFLRMVFIGLR
jgi:hypothetical protein